MGEPKFNVGDKVSSKSGAVGVVMVMNFEPLGFAYLVEKIDGQTEEFKESDLEKVK